MATEVNENTNLKEEITDLKEIELEEQKQKKLLNLAEILTNLLLEESKLNEVKLKLNLDNEYLDLLRKISDMFPVLFQEIDESISEIVSDKVIDSNDVPRLMVLIKNVYKKFSDSKKLNSIKKITIEDSINFIKNLLLILIELEHIKVKDKENVILIIDLCIDLLTSSIDVSSTIIDKLKECFKC